MDKKKKAITQFMLTAFNKKKNLKKIVLSYNDVYFVRVNSNNTI